MNKPHKTLPKTAAVQPAKTTSIPTATEAMRADQTAAFLREVDDAMRAEKWQKRWQQGKWPLFGAVVLAVTGTAAWQGWQNWQAHGYRSVAAAWDDLGRVAGDAELAKQLPTFINNSQGGYQALAQMALAALATDPMMKAAAFNQLAGNSKQPAWLRAMGQLNAAITLLATNPAEAQTQLELLAQTTIGTTPLPTVPVALELLALHAMQKNDAATARAYTQKLLNLTEQGGILTPAQRQRALQRLGALGGVSV